MRISSIQSYNNDCRRKQNPNFGLLKLDGQIGLKLTQEALDKGLLYQYAKHSDTLIRSGSNGVAIHIGNPGGGRTSLSLAIPSLTTDYEIPLAIAEKGKFLETWLNLKPENIKEATESLISFIQSKKII